MNQTVRAWNRCLARPKCEGPDSIVVDDVKITLPEEKEMPGKKKEKRERDKKKGPKNRVRSLGGPQFNRVIRVAKLADIDQVRQLRTATFTTLKELKVKRDLSKAVVGVPKGSDQVNSGDVLRWLRQVPSDDAAAVAQVVALDATLQNRTVG